MCYYSTEKQSFKTTLKLISIFLIYSLVFSGLLTITNTTFYFISKSYKYSVSYSQLCMALLLLYISTKTVLVLLARQTPVNSNYKTVKITNNNSRITLTGYCDSGNTLTTPDKLPVFIAYRNVLLTVVGSNAEIFDYIKCNTILNEGLIPIFKPDKITVDNIPVEAYIGITENSFYSDYDILLGATSNNLHISNTEDVYV